MNMTDSVSMLSRDAELKLVWRAFCLMSEFWICLHRLHQLRRFALLVGAVMGVEIGETSSVCRCRWALPSVGAQFRSRHRFLVHAPTCKV